MLIGAMEIFIFQHLVGYGKAGSPLLRIHGRFMNAAGFSQRFPVDKGWKAIFGIAVFRDENGDGSQDDKKATEAEGEIHAGSKGD